ncbi:MucB/RseB C-terminal domain-containing protein [Vogesella sp. LIG4]|uniref:MucB/RseB C-terminal domain-containing protein n=1 Tax=Vogesella sp. LIG4 TaxID=1192162 RepID=UPI00081F9286|nr:MucB/RseB C-terminal domain-containing protein [Vogesella sp. LIG4]SCK23262.1 sigma E regulatory protein, MucB/RseB [Vogesella sp. LIG4]
MRRFVVCVLFTVPLLAQAEDDWSLLRRAAVAGQSLTFTAAYSHQLGGELETFRIYRANDDGLLRERRESLDGLPREIVRHGGELTCYAPDTKSLSAAKLSAVKLFPAILPDAQTDLAAAYSISRGGSDRVAQRDCQWLQLKPRESNTRYTQKLCVDTVSGLPLKAVTMGVRGEVIEQFAFTELDLTGERDKTLLKPRYKQALPLGRGIATQPSAVPPLEVKGMPAGFHLLRYMSRPLPGHEQAVQHYVYTDGFAKLSLFVEEAGNDTATHPVVIAPNGIGVASRRLGEQLVTVVGDLPEAGLQSVLKNIRLVPK